MLTPPSLQNETTDVVIQQQSQTPDDGHINAQNMLSLSVEKKTN